MKYADILLSQLDSIRPFIIQNDDVRCNLSGTRCIIKWDGVTPQEIIDLGCTIRDKSQALSYYRDPLNGWEIVW